MGEPARVLEPQPQGGALNRGGRMDYRPKTETFAWLDSQEEAFFAGYLDRGSLTAVIAAIIEASKHHHGVSRETVYQWLKADDARWIRWNEARELRGHLSFDEAMSEAESADPDNAHAQRLKFESKRWAAEVQNRAIYGKQPAVAVAIGVGGEWASALSLFDGSTSEASPLQRTVRVRAEADSGTEVGLLPSGEPSHPEGT